MLLSAIKTPKKKSEVRKTKEYRKFKKAIESVDLDRLNKLMPEIEITIKERAKALAHLKSTITIKKLEDILASETRARSYLTEQYRFTSSALAILSTNITNTREALAYADPLDYKCKTITETKFKYRETMASWIEARNALNEWVELIRAVMEDIDKASWGLRNVVKLRELETYRENQST